METILELSTLLGSLRFIVIFICAVMVGLTICKGKSQKKSSNGEKEKNGKNIKKSETDEDVKIDINVKPVEEKRDEFDDDEENPLAKIPTKPRVPKQQKAVGGASTSRTSSTLGSKIEPEASFFAPHEKTTNASCYMVKTANKG